MSGLSSRGERYTKAGRVREQLMQIWEDKYHIEENPTGFLNLGTAENYVMLDEVTNFINEQVKFKGEDVDYGAGPWGSIRFRNAMASHINKYFKPLKPVLAENLLFSTGCTSICDMLGHALFEPGEGLLLGRPIYQAFQTDFGLKAEVKCIFASFDNIDQFTVAAVKRYEVAIEESKVQGTAVRAMILCNPHNPLGQCYEPEALVEYMKLCQKHKMHLILDEIYALSVYKLPHEEEKYDPELVSFESILSFDTDKYLDTNYLHLLYGFSKDLASGGLRIGCIWTRNEELISALSSLDFVNWPANFCETVGIAMLENEKWLDSFIQTSQRRLGGCSALARSVLDEYGIPYVHKARAGFFLWIDVGNFLAKENAEVTWEQHTEFKKLLRKHKVYITGGDGLASEKPGFFRLCYVKPEAEVRAGLERLMATIVEATEVAYPIGR